MHVTLGRLTGPAEISTQQGSIDIGEATSHTVVLRTQMGDVTVGAGPNGDHTLVSLRRST